MTKEEILAIAYEKYGSKAPIQGIKEYQDYYIVTFVAGWDKIFIDKKTKKAFWEDELAEIPQEILSKPYQVIK